MRSGKLVFFSVMADEVSSHNVERMPICLRFVDEKFDIREDFVTFVRLERVRASDILHQGHCEFNRGTWIVSE